MRNRVHVEFERQAYLSLTMYDVSRASLGLPSNFFHNDFDCFNVHSNYPRVLKISKGL